VLPEVVANQGSQGGEANNKDDDTPSNEFIFVQCCPNCNENN
jgi:hypothetical protein